MWELDHQEGWSNLHLLRLLHCRQFLYHWATGEAQIYGCGSWTIKKAECQRIGAFQLWCCRRLLKVPQTPRRWNQSILKEINPEYSLEGLMLKLLYFGHLMQRADSLEKTLMLGKIEGRRRGRYRRRWLDGFTSSMDISLTPGDSERLRSPMCCSPRCHQTRQWLNKNKSPFITDWVLDTGLTFVKIKLIFKRWKLCYSFCWEGSCRGSTVR